MIALIDSSFTYEGEKNIIRSPDQVVLPKCVYRIKNIVYYMGCCVSIQGLDYDQLRSPVVLQTIGDNTRYHGTTERNRLQVCFFSILFLLLISINRLWVRLN